MGYLRSELMHQKILDAEADINEFMRENELPEDVMIQAFELSKEVFKDESEAIEYVESRGFYSEDIEDEEEKYTFNIREVGQFRDGLNRIEVRRGVSILVGSLRPVSNLAISDEVEFSLKPLEIKNFSNKAPLIIEVAKVVKGFHPKYGSVEITEEDLKSMERNFRAKVTGVDLSINKDHEKVEALGWFKDVFLSFDGKTLLAEVAWCPQGVSVLKDKSFRYFSPEFSFNYEHPHTGEKYGPTLTGGALTNYPFLKMNAITDLNTKPNDGGRKVDTISLKAHDEEVKELNAKISSLESEQEKARTTIEGLKTQNTELSEKISTMEKEKKASEEKAKNEKLFNDGVISKVQLEKLNEMEDASAARAVLELNAKSLHTEADGADNDGQEPKESKLTEEEREFCSKMNLSEEDYIKYNS